MSGTGKKKNPIECGKFLSVLERCTKKADVLKLLEDEGYIGEQAEAAKRHWMQVVNFKRRAKAAALNKAIDAKKRKAAINPRFLKR